MYLGIGLLAGLIVAAFAYRRGDIGMDP